MRKRAVQRDVALFLNLNGAVAENMKSVYGLCLIGEGLVFCLITLRQHALEN